MLCWESNTQDEHPPRKPALPALTWNPNDPRWQYLRRRRVNSYRDDALWPEGGDFLPVQPQMDEDEAEYRRRKA